MSPVVETTDRGSNAAGSQTAPSCSILNSCTDSSTLDPDWNSDGSRVGRAP